MASADFSRPLPPGCPCGSSDTLDRAGRSLEVRHAFFSQTRRIYRAVFRMTIGRPRPWPGDPHYVGLVSASCTSHPGFRHRLSSDPASRRTPLPRRMVPVITVHRGLTPLECTSLLVTPGKLPAPPLALEWRRRQASSSPAHPRRSLAMLSFRLSLSTQFEVLHLLQIFAAREEF